MARPAHNQASIRVLVKCGFARFREGKAVPIAGSLPVEEVIIRLGPAPG
jgi:RimJ/RimL family protein N-acetyltransferase